MSLSIKESLDIISRYDPMDGDVNSADAAIEYILGILPNNQIIEILLNLFERFPEEDSDNVFWSALHTLETLPGYENYLVRSVQRTPSDFGLLMINRVINSGQQIIGQTSLIGLLEEVERDVKLTEALRGEASGYLEYQRRDSL